MYLILVFKILVQTFGSFNLSKTARKIGEKAHQVSLEKVLCAPVNNFFDVTPIGKVIKMFNEDMNVF